MSAIKQFFRTSIIGGLIVVLPIAILIGLFLWVWGKVGAMIEGPTNALLNSIGIAADNADDIARLLAQLIVLAAIILACFFIGLIVRTAVGNYLHTTVEGRLLKKLPGYSLVKETVLQFLGDRESPFSSVALCRIFGNETLVTAFVTDRHANGMVTVFVPTGPNPTSGNIYHLKREFIYPVSLPVEDVMRSIISCGAGSTALIEHYQNALEETAAVD